MQKGSQRVIWGLKEDTGFLMKVTDYVSVVSGSQVLRSAVATKEIRMSQGAPECIRVGIHSAVLPIYLLHGLQSGESLVRPDPGCRPVTSNAPRPTP
ncbi:unnamed protein product [Leptidea sinapis]|uniref:Uncharacterized protein n=1 Tax=Leptidea sinapis TaxID=189913 RepID=A0A5E4QUS3_9NEOP|nr:unnamed protein product [Leptidea sinapis]